MLFTNFNNVTRFSSIVHICFFKIQMFWSSARREVAQMTYLPWWMRGQRKVHWDPIGQLMSVYQKRITPKWDSNRMVTICFKTWGLKKNPFKKSFFFKKKIFFHQKAPQVDPPTKQRWPCGVSRIPSRDFSVKYCFSVGVSSAEIKFRHLDIVFIGKIDF